MTTLHLRLTQTSRNVVTQNRWHARHDFVRRWCVTSLCYVVLMARPAPGQQRQTVDGQLRESQSRLENIRRERSTVEQELERLRTQVHSLSDELANLDRQKQSTTRIVNELDRQIGGLSQQIDNITVDLVLAEDALQEKKAVAERRIVDIYKRGPLYAYEVLLRAESFGDLLSRYKYLYLVSRQDRLLANDMFKLRNRVAQERRQLVDARQALERRRAERTDELGRFERLERERQANLREMRRSEREAQRRLGELERDERVLNDRIAALERARREAEARGAAATTGRVRARPMRIAPSRRFISGSPCSGWETVLLDAPEEQRGPGPCRSEPSGEPVEEETYGVSASYRNLAIWSRLTFVFGQNVALRHPHKIRIGDNVVIDDNCLLDAKGELVRVGNDLLGRGPRARAASRNRRSQRTRHTPRTAVSAGTPMTCTA